MGTRSLTIVLCAALAACGAVESRSDASPPAPDAGAAKGGFSCRTNDTSLLRTCTEYSFSGPPPSSLATECAQKGGMAGTTCDHAHSEGGCLFSTTIDGVQTNYVYWYYYDSPEDIMASCAEAKVPYVAP